MVAEGEGAARIEDANPDPGIHEHEASKVAVLRAPREPTQREIEEHELNHCPYRAWCRSCVAGKGKSQQHWQDVLDEANRALPCISWDYAYMGEKENPRPATDFPMLVGKDMRNRWYYCHPVPSKGAASAWAAQGRYSSADFSQWSRSSRRGLKS